MASIGRANDNLEDNKSFSSSILIDFWFSFQSFHSPLKKASQVSHISLSIMCFSGESDRQQEPPRPWPTTQVGSRQTGRAQSARPAATRSARRPDVQIPLRQMRPPMSRGHIPPDVLPYIARVIDYQLGNLKYAIIGGAACFLLGSTRLTHDFDIIVLDGTKKSAMAKLSQNKELFGSAQGGIWVNTEDGGRYNLDVIEPRQIRQRFSGGSGEIIKIQGVNVLRPSLLLEYKQYSYAHRDAGRQASKNTDAMDLQFLTRYLTNSG